jgi:RNA polymerase sigma factor (sigma-70 family)
VGAAAGQRFRGAAGGEGHGLLGAVASPEGEGEPGSEAVPGAVGILEGVGKRGDFVRARSAAGLFPRAPPPAGRDDDEVRRRPELTGRVALARVQPTPDERVELDSGLGDRGEDAGGRDENACGAGKAEGFRVAADEVDGVRATKLFPGERVGAARHLLLADDRDRALPVAVHEGEAAPLRLSTLNGLDAHAEPFELRSCPQSELAFTEGCVERAGSGEASQLDGGDAPTARGLCPPLGRVDDLALGRDPFDAGELDPFDVPDHGDSHGGSLTSGRAPAFQKKMEAVAEATIPPFERFYEERKDEVFGYLARLLGWTAAEDAFQETFLRALRAYERLEHGRHLRAWIFTIATRVALDERRRAAPAAEAVEVAVLDSRPTYAQLEHLTGALPPTERAAVVLRYGYDLSYDDIGAALGSSSDAARQAASSGVRRLRRRNS